MLLALGGKRVMLADFGVAGQVEHTEDLRRSIAAQPDPPNDPGWAVVGLFFWMGLKFFFFGGVAGVWVSRVLVRVSHGFLPFPFLEPPKVAIVSIGTTNQ